VFTILTKMIAAVLAIIVTVVPVQQESQKIRCTCYLPTGNRTYDGTEPYEGIVAANKEHLGDMALLWTIEGEWIGLFECRDIGGGKMLKNGMAIDIFRDDMDSVKEWIQMYGDYVQIIWIPAEG